MTPQALAQPVPIESLRVVDGDTVSVGGHQYRLVGCDTPETTRAKCNAERSLGERAKARLQQLVSRPDTTLTIIAWNTRMTDGAQSLRAGDQASSTA